MKALGIIFIIDFSFIIICGIGVHMKALPFLTLLNFFQSRAASNEFEKRTGIKCS
jgi:hypothetical protein